MSRESEALIDRMLDLAEGEEALDVANAAYSIFTLALAKLDHEQREHLLALIDDGALRFTLTTVWEAGGYMNDAEPRTVN